METPDLISPAYWESESVDLRLNPKRPVEAAGLREFLEGELGLRAVVVLATSGSSGSAKFVVLPKAAILASARAVNAHCGLETEDVWLGGLPTFHVGGLGIYARAFCNGAQVAAMAWDSWTRDGAAFLRAVDEGPGRGVRRACAGFSSAGGGSTRLWWRRRVRWAGPSGPPTACPRRLRRWRRASTATANGCPCCPAGRRKRTEKDG